jgi:hypothetical protein|tara:strand:- start:1891 stop:2814 length:924 start_codon:yes stop_codon:yes gene_type:complete
MAYITPYQYYENGGQVPENENWGSYQYVSLQDIVNNYMLMYVGNNKLINNIDRYQVLFHAKRAIQELNYDAFKEIKILELNVDDSLKYILPPDYVNWVRVSLYHNKTLFPLTENIQTNYASAYLQDSDNRILFDQDGNVLQPENSNINLDRLDGTKKSIYYNQNSPYDQMEGWCINGYWYFDYAVGKKFGMNTETANALPTFKINSKAGVINFSSGIKNKLVILEYVSDGMENGDNSLITVNKLFEEFVYSYISYSILNTKINEPEYIINRYRKSKSALLRNAKIRMSNIHPGRLLMNLRGQDKIIK